MARRSIFTLLAAVLPSILAQSNVMVLESKNFTDFIGKGTPALVEFYAPWCGHCKNLAPVYEQLGHVYAHAKDKVIIAKVDADGAGRDVGSKYGVTGFPTLKWFDGEGKDEKYEGGRELEAFAQFIQRKTGASARIPPPPPTDVVLVDTDNFGKVVMDKTKDVFIAFTAPWCGHCKSLKPIWQNIATWLKPEKDVVIALIDADAPQNRHLGTKYGINAFPTIFHFPKGSSEKEPVKYNGYNMADNLMAYVNQQSGTHRAEGGYLNDRAGRVATLDTLASELFHGLPTLRPQLYEEAQTAAQSAGSAGAYYLRVMQKIIEGGEQWVEKESKRLGSIFEKKQAPLSKLDEVKRKLNVLHAFTIKYVDAGIKDVEDVVEDVKEAFASATQAVKDEL